MYSPTTSLADPPSTSPIADGLAWTQGVALGPAATSIAIIAVAAIGFLMLSGRLDLRRGITVVAGCFILFGAGGIAAAVTRLAGAEARPNAFVVPHDAGPLRPTASPTAPPNAYDPYAGASVPAPR